MRHRPSLGARGGRLGLLAETGGIREADVPAHGVMGGTKAPPVLGLAVQQQARARRIALDEPGLIKKVTRMEPVSSNTVASTSGRMPRRRTGREAIARTSTATVACSPGTSPATVRASRRSRGRCSSRSPTVSNPSACAPSRSFAPGRASGMSSTDGRGQRSGASRSSERSRGRACAKARGPAAPATAPGTASATKLVIDTGHDDGACGGHSADSSHQ